MPLCTINEVADRLKLSPATVRVAIRRGSIPAVRLGRSVRVAEEALDALERVGHPLLTRRPAEVVGAPSTGAGGRSGEGGR